MKCEKLGCDQEAAMKCEKLRCDQEADRGVLLCPECIRLWILAGKPDARVWNKVPLAREVVITDPTTGGQKGSKLEAVALIPAVCILALARVYGEGAKKYAPYNWAKGYAWSLSYSALQRHLGAFWSGEDIDEDGEPHLMHAAWHCFTLYCFSKFGLGTDDRWLPKEAE